MNIIKEIRDRLFRILRPNYWIQNYPTCDKYSDEIENLIDSGAEVEVIDRFTAKIDGRKLWIENYPYAYGREEARVENYYYMYGVYFYENLNEGFEVLPTARVRKKLKNYIAEHE